MFVPVDFYIMLVACDLYLGSGFALNRTPNQATSCVESITQVADDGIRLASQSKLYNLALSRFLFGCDPDTRRA